MDSTVSFSYYLFHHLHPGPDRVTDRPGFLSPFSYRVDYPHLLFDRRSRSLLTDSLGLGSLVGSSVGLIFRSVGTSHYPSLRLRTDEGYTTISCGQRHRGDLWVTRSVIVVVWGKETTLLRVSIGNGMCDLLLLIVHIVKGFLQGT